MADITQFRQPLYSAQPIGKIAVGRVFSLALVLIGRAWTKFYAISLLVALLALPSIASLLIKGNGALHLVTIICRVAKPIFALLAQVALIHATMRLLSDEPFEIGEAFKVGARRFLPYVGATIILVLGIFLGLVLLVVPGIILACMYGLSPIISVVERMGPIESQTRSRELTTNNRWRILGVSLLFYLLPGLLFFGVGVMTALTHKASLPGLVAVQAGAQVFSFLCMPLYVTLPVALYHELRQVTGTSGPRGISGVFD